MPNLNRIIDTINHALPTHGVGEIYPENILKHRRTNCFGRAALVGAALTAEGADPDDMSLLISYSHGEPRTDGRAHFGHVILSIASTEVPSPTLIDSIRTVYIRPTESLLPLPRHQGYVDAIALGEMSPGFDRSDPPVLPHNMLEGNARVEAFRPYFRRAVGGLLAGMIDYQRTHPHLNRPPLLEIEDYIQLYDELARQSPDG